MSRIYWRSPRTYGLCSFTRQPTDMLAGIDAPKTPPPEVAAALLNGLAADQEDIFPDPNAQTMSQTWWSDPKGFERAFSGAAAA